MNVITLDLETYWTSDYSLSKMSPLEYVKDPRFEIISVSVKLDDYPTDVVFGHDNVRLALSKLDWSTKAVCGHNMSGFDAYVLAYVLGIRPKLWLCTLAMARPLHAKTVGLSLAKLVKHYGLGVKDNTVLMETRGKHLSDFTPDEIERMKVYNRDDTNQCRELFKRLKPHYNANELWQIDALTRMRTEPQFELDMPLLETAASIERDRKHKAFIDLSRTIGVSSIAEDGSDKTPEQVETEVKTILASAPKFSELLGQLGVATPMKPSPSNPDKDIPALAKTDEEFLALQDHDDPVVAAAARARLDVKSTLLETRLQKFLTAGQMAEGRLPVPLKYCGADTTGRDSGEEYNCMTAGHELLTPTGWVDIADWAPSTPVMQWWPDGSLTWCAEPSKVSRPETGELVVFDAPFVRGRFTKDHRVVHFCGGVARDVTAGSLVGTSGLDKIPAAGFYDGVDNPNWSDDQIRLMVALAADGHAGKYHFKWGFRRERKIERLTELLTRAGIAFRTYDYRGRPHGHYVITVRRRDAAAFSKGFGPWVLGLSGRQMDILLAEIPLWDGTRHHSSGNTCYYTSLKDQADWVATVAHLRGVPARRGERNPKKFDLYFRSSAMTSVTREQVVVAPAYEMVYCPTVDSSYVLVRFNGAIHVTGNCQNLPRINPSKPRTRDALRKSLRAPKGMKVIVADQSGIELRVNHFLWKVKSTMDLYKADPAADLYRAAGAQVYGVPPDQVTKDQRQVEKIKALGLGFGAGAATFVRVAKALGGMDITLEQSQSWVESWRAQYAEVALGWKKCHAMLPYIHGGQEEPVDPWGMVTTCAEGLRLPSGRIIRYPALRREVDDKSKTEWWYGEGRHKARIYAGKITENIVQALARDSIFDCAIDFYKLTKLRPALRVHDELVYVVPEGQAEERLDQLQGIMRTPPRWWPELIVWSEGDIASNYGDAK